ncbi:calcium-binding protein [Hansschlegelia sp. KR7-227]|uniref:calcium-binding protein n=1 Tax=Hansschlegelia sp. KR7-227 TaxID=3400914 RepID=UPI003C01B2A7
MLKHHYDQYHPEYDVWPLDADTPRNFEGDDNPNRWVGSNVQDFIRGNGGNDTLYGQAGDRDDLFGGDGNDLIYGGSGSDFIHGDSGRDRLFGGSGSDRLFGGVGNDVMTSGGGNDMFTFGVTTREEDRRFGLDVITDFEVGVDLIAFQAAVGRPAYFDDFDDLMRHTHNDSSGNAIIRYNSNNIIRLIDVGKEDLSAEDFFFG